MRALEDWVPTHLVPRGGALPRGVPAGDQDSAEGCRTLPRGGGVFCLHRVGVCVRTCVREAGWFQCALEAGVWRSLFEVAFVESSLRCPEVGGDLKAPRGEGELPTNQRLVFLDVSGDRSAARVAPRSAAPESLPRGKDSPPGR